MHHDRLSAQGREVEKDVADRKNEGAGDGAAQTLLALQQTVGNAGTSTLIRGRAARERRVARLVTGNPGDLAPVPGATAGTFTSTGTTHAAPGIEDAENHAPPTTDTGGRSEEMSVRVTATADSPVVAETASEAQLFQRQLLLESDPATPLASTGFTTVKEVRGSADAPIIDEAADESLFIDPGPKADDVQQGQIGDCWDMATFIGIVNRDPGKIRSMMTPDGSGGASVTLYYRSAQIPPNFASFFGGRTSLYSAETVSVSNEVAFDRSSASAGGTAPATDRALRYLTNGQPYGHQIHGARLRAAPTPKTRKWFCVVNGDTLEIHRLDIYQMSRWAPILEKAGARFTELHGQYGKGGDTSEGEKNLGAGQGYANISGGFPGYTLSIFYGAEGEFTAGGQGDTSQLTWSPATAGTNAQLFANAAAFDRLLTLAGRQRSYQPGETDAPVVTARTWGDAAGDNLYIPRLQAALFAAALDPDWANLTPQAQGDLTAVLAAIAVWTVAVPDPTPMPTPPPANCKTVTHQALVAAARQASDPVRNPGVSDNARSERHKAMLDELLIVKNMPVDWSKGTRSVYAGHEYSVLSFDVRYTAAAPAGFQIQEWPASQRPVFYQFVDVNASQVTLMNPHHMNEPNPTGTAGDTGGVFTISLDRFLRLYAEVMSADFKIPAP